MNKTKYTLLGKFFAIAAVIQVIGVTAFVSSVGLYVFLGLGILLLIVVLMDRQELSKFLELKSVIRSQRDTELGKEESYRCLFYGIDLSDHHPERFTLCTPESEHLVFSKAQPIESEPTDHETPESFFGFEIPHQGFSLGKTPIKDHKLLISSRLKFWQLSIKIPCEPFTITVHPSSKSVSETRFHEIMRGQRLFRMGNRKIMRGQSAEQFYTIRKFQFSDPLKHIDPKKTAKFQTPMTRIYESFFEHHLVIGLDLGRSMAGYLGNSQKLDFYKSAVKQLSESAFKSRDKVSFFAFSDQLHQQVSRAKNPTEIWKLLSTESNLKVKSHESSYELLPQFVAKLSSTRCMFVLLTDGSRPSVQSSIAQSLYQLSQKHVCVIASILDEATDLKSSIENLNLSKPLSVESTEYSNVVYNYHLYLQLEDFKSKLDRQLCGFVTAAQDEWLPVVSRVYDRLKTSTAL